MFFLIGLAYYFAGGQDFLGLHSGKTPGEPCPWTVVAEVNLTTSAAMT
jgi:hypothetical protein